jgi:hypothetical protein
MNQQLVLQFHEYPKHVAAKHHEMLMRQLGPPTPRSSQLLRLRQTTMQAKAPRPTCDSISRMGEVGDAKTFS